MDSQMNSQMNTQMDSQKNTNTNISEIKTPVKLDTNEVNADDNICLSIKSKKKSDKRCSCKRKKGELFCGRHLKSKIIYKCPPTNNEVVKIQSYIRRFNIQNRMKCINDDDFFTCDTSLETNGNYFFKTDDNYFFDIRSLYKLFTSTPLKKYINPYTTSRFSNNSITRYTRHLKYLKSKKIPVIFIDETQLTPEQEYRDKLLNVFQKFDLLGHYTDTDWFDKLTLSKLKKLYFSAEDIWNYRIQMPNMIRHRIIPGGVAFNNAHYIIRSYDEHDKGILRNIILDEFNNFITYAMDINDRKLGAMLMMTALVEVSPDAAAIMPYYVQSSL